MKRAKQGTKPRRGAIARRPARRASARSRGGGRKTAMSGARSRVQAVPAGFQTVTPHLTLRGAAEAIDFYKRAFGAKERGRMPGPDGRTIMHAELRIGSSIVFIADEFPGVGPRAPHALGGTTGSLHLYVPNVDAAFARAVAAGAEVRMPVQDMFWGDRYAKVADPFGHEWGLATHKEDLSAKQIGERSQAFFAKMSGSPGLAGSGGGA